MSVRVLIVEDEPYMAEAIRDGLRLEAIAADGDTALELLSINDYDIAVLDRDIGVRAGARRLPHEALRGPGARARSTATAATSRPRKQFAVLEVLVGAEGGVVSGEELLARAWDENADPFTNAARITVSALRKRLGDPPIIATVPGVDYRVRTDPDTGCVGAEHG